jgi:hypothetical protein
MLQSPSKTLQILPEVGINVSSGQNRWGGRSHLFFNG